jgi:hypothetical protein
MKNLSRNHDLVAPTGPLVQLTFGNATSIVASTEGALFISAQEGELGMDAARLQTAKALKNSRM